MRAILFVTALVLLASSATAAPTDLFLHADGSLSTASSGTAQTCLSISTAAPTAIRSFTEAPISDGERRLAQGSLVLQLAFSDNSLAGTGFSITATLTPGNGTALSAGKDYGAGTAIDSPTLLVFDIPANLTFHGGLGLNLRLATAGGIPLGVAQADILCDTPDTRLVAVPFLAAPNEPGPPLEDASDGGLDRLSVIAVSLAAAVVTLAAGAFVLAGRTVSERRIHLLLGATAGLLLTVAVVDLIPEAIELSEWAPFTMAAGLLVLFLVRQVAGHDHGHGGHGPDEHDGHGHDGDDGHDAHGHDGHHHDAATVAGERFVARHPAQGVGGLAFVAFFALAFHRFVDGLVLPAAFSLGDSLGFGVAAAVLLHQFPDGIAAATVFLAAGWHRRRVLKGVSFMAIMTPLGTLVGLLLAAQDGLVGHLTALAAATFVFIALAELLPELGTRKHRVPVGLGFILGCAVGVLVVILPRLVGVEV